MRRKTDALPSDSRSLWKMVVQLQRDLAELRAARTLENASIGAGGVTVQAAGARERLVLTPAATLGVEPGPGEPLYHPPATEFWSGLDGEVTPGTVTGYVAVGEFGGIPTLDVITPDLGSGTSFLRLQAGNSGGDTAAAQITVGDSEIVVTQAAVFVVAAGRTYVIDDTGVNFGDEVWTNLALSAGWTAAPAPYAPPQFLARTDRTVMLQGSTVPGTLTAGTVIATLPNPVGDGRYWPFADLEYRCPGGTAGATVDIVIHAADGTIAIVSTAGSVTRVSLSGVLFST